MQDVPSDVPGSGRQGRGSPGREGRPGRRIERHDASHIVQLDDGSRWRIWPGDLATTLGWTPDTRLRVTAIDDERCSHALVDEAPPGAYVRVIGADDHWRPADAAESLRPKPDGEDAGA